MRPDILCQPHRINELRRLSPRRDQSLTGTPMPGSGSRAGESDDDVIPPPSSVNVAADARMVLYAADGRPLIRRIGYETGK